MASLLLPPGSAQASPLPPPWGGRWESQEGISFDLLLVLSPVLGNQANTYQSQEALTQGRGIRGQNCFVTGTFYSHSVLSPRLSLLCFYIDEL